ncbi:MAG: NitT/TauT family transport system permease protein [Granulosicoccus sp.]|jgi:NitT/TauT family transport system permease protein
MPVKKSSIFPVIVVVLAITIVWYASAVLMNLAWEKSVAERAGTSVPMISMIQNTMDQDRPVLPAPHQVVEEVINTTFKKKITSKRSLIYHARITLSSSMLGFLLGTMLGIVLAVAIVYNQALNKSLMPWIIASQTIPILAIAPMIIVVLNAIGVQGLLPKAFISMYLSFFPIVVGMVKGLNSPDRSHQDLMRTYSASGTQTFFKLRLPTSLPFLFTSMKVAVAISLVGAIVAELPTGAVAGLGARLLAGSYYGQTIQIWSALVVASVLAASLVFLVGAVGSWVNRRMGLQQSSSEMGAS